jgi:chlorobactene glucosyltransferase
MFFQGLVTWLILLILVTLSSVFIILIQNLFCLKRLDQFPVSSHYPKVSILVPARNEENNILGCVQSLLDQDYPDFEVLVLDDESTDKTLDILTQLSSKYSHLKVIQGKPLPPEWMGKHWACHQLSDIADGELILFTDADTFHGSLTLRESVSALLNQDADLLSVIPYEVLGSWGEKIMLPYIFSSCLFFIPISIAHHVRNPALCFSIGQFMLFKRESYRKIGGHASIKGSPMEDLILGRKVKKTGLRWRLADGGLRVKCRMYHDFQSSWKGLSRFLFLGYEDNLQQLFLAWGWTILIFLGPFILVLLQVLGVISLSSVNLTRILAAILLNYVIWGLSYWKLRYPIFLSLFYPVTFIMNFLATFNSLYLTKTRQTTWKDRPLFRNRV